MKLKQEDRNLLHEFFNNQSEWMKKNSLLNSGNIIEFKRHFLKFIHSKNCGKNLACKCFIITLEEELLKCEKKQLIELYNADVSDTLKLNNFAPTLELATDNQSILDWIEESSIMSGISQIELYKLSSSIGSKIQKNKAKVQVSYEQANKIVK